MKKLLPSRIIALDKLVPEECTQLWADGAPPFYVRPQIPQTCLDLAGVLRSIGFPSAVAASVMDAAVGVFGAWIKNTPNVAMNMDGKLDDADAPMLLLYVIDTGMTVESSDPKDMAAAKKFCGIQIAFHEPEDDEEA